MAVSNIFAPHACFWLQLLKLVSQLVKLKKDNVRCVSGLFVSCMLHYNQSDGLILKNEKFKPFFILIYSEQTEEM